MARNPALSRRLLGAYAGVCRSKRIAVRAVELLLSAAWLAIMAWLMQRAIKQRGLLPRLAQASAPSAADAQPLAVIVPAAR